MDSNYSTIERECLAIVWGVTKFQEYLYGKEFLLETDHHPLKYFCQAKFQNGRLMRWVMTLQPYRFLLREFTEAKPRRLGSPTFSFQQAAVGSQVGVQEERCSKDSGKGISPSSLNETCNVF